MTLDEPFILSLNLRGSDQTFAFTCTLIHASEQVLRFRVIYKDKEMEVQKTLIPKKRFAWKLTKSNFAFNNEFAAENLNIIFDALDKLVKKPRSAVEYLQNKKSW